MSNDFEFNMEDDLNTGSKRTLSFVLNEIKSHGHNAEKVWDDIKELVTMLLISLHPFIQFNYDV